MSPLLLVTIKLAAVALPLAAAGPRAADLSKHAAGSAGAGARVDVVCPVGACRGSSWPLAVLDVLVASFIVGDLWTLPRARSLPSNAAGHIASLRQRHAVELAVSNLAAPELLAGDPRRRAHVLNPHPAEFAQQLDGRSRVFLEYAMRPESSRRVHPDAHSPPAAGAGCGCGCGISITAARRRSTSIPT